MRRREHRPGVEQGPRPERGRRRRCPEHERFGRNLRQLLLDQHRAPVQARGIDRPIALDRPQLCRRIRNRGDRNLLRVEPDIRGPCRGARRPRGDQQAAVRRVRATELMVELLGKSLCGEVSSANAHGRQHRTPGLARRGTFAKLPEWPSIQILPSSPERSRGRAAPSSLPEPGSAPSSGIPDFRSPGGIWTRMAPIDFSDFLASEEARRETWRRRFAMEETFRAAAPNRGHRAVAELVRRGTAAAVITQNIDGLHQASGIPDERVIELHGNTTYAHCLDCKTRYELDALRIAFERSGTPPLCDDCGGFVKTATISFGQAMPSDAMRRAEIETRAADLFIVAGSSLVVYPAAAFPELAKHNGATLVIINREPTGLDAIADLVLNRSIGETVGAAVGVD